VLEPDVADPRCPEIDGVPVGPGGCGTQAHLRRQPGLEVFGDGLPIIDGHAGVEAVAHAVKRGLGRLPGGEAAAAHLPARAGRRQVADEPPGAVPGVGQLGTLLAELAAGVVPARAAAVDRALHGVASSSVAKTAPVSIARSI
jgi:hypothetical protein